MIFLISFSENVNSQCLNNAISAAFKFECVAGTPTGARLGIDSVVFIVPNSGSYFAVAGALIEIFKNGVPFPSGIFIPGDEVKIKPISTGQGNISWVGNQNGCAASGAVNFDICVAAMPVIWHSPTSAIIKNETTQITWSVATQINNEKYIIEHSPNGSNFSPIGDIPGDGTYNATKHYEYIHTSPSFGMNYYRIKQVDFDGKYSYSDIASVRYDEDSNINIYPNPATSEVTITTSETTTLQIMDVYGKLYKQQDISEGQNTINLSELPSGILIFVVGDHRYKVLKK
ncbi:MAG: T9SS type A sorting domain-containing protein [Saprospiraceae bacterium]|nr:T9SS type A sorting domain-containing protein [Saprospiraceae bacterium]